MKPWAHFSALLTCICAMLAAGCTPELSKLEGVSIKRCYHQSGGSGQDAQGRYREEGQLWAFIGDCHRDLRVIASVDLTQSYDLKSSPMDLGTGGERARTELLWAVRETFGISIWVIEREIPVLVLVRREGERLALRPSPPDATQRMDQQPPPRICCDPIADIASLFRPYEPTRYSFTAHSMTDLAPILESDGTWLRTPEASSHVVVDETGLQGRYDFELVVDYRMGLTMREAVREIGLDLAPARRTIKAVYVDIDPSKRPAVPPTALGDRLQVYSAWDSEPR